MIWQLHSRRRPERVICGSHLHTLSLSLTLTTGVRTFTAAAPSPAAHGDDYRLKGPTQILAARLQ